MMPVNLFKALSDETRVRLLNLALHHELNVNEIVGIMEMGQSRISRHLKILSDGGLLTFRRDGLWSYYSAVSEGEAGDFIQSIRFLFEGDGVFRKDLANAERRVAERSLGTARFFDTVAENWERLKQEIIGDVDINCLILDALPEVETVVDLGCGTGDLLPLLKRKADRVIGVEKSARMLEEARKHFETVRDRIDIRIGELEHLPLRDGEVGAAVTSMVLHHLPDPRLAFREACRVLGDGGRFLIIDLLSHGDEAMRERFGDFWLGFSPEIMEKWLRESGFRVGGIEIFSLQKGLKGFLLQSTKSIQEGE